MLLRRFVASSTCSEGEGKQGGLRKAEPSPDRCVATELAVMSRNCWEKEQGKEKRRRRKRWTQKISVKNHRKVLNQKPLWITSSSPSCWWFSCFSSHVTIISSPTTNLWLLGRRPWTADTSATSAQTIKQLLRCSESGGHTHSHTSVQPDVPWITTDRGGTVSSRPSPASAGAVFF